VAIFFFFSFILFFSGPSTSVGDPGWFQRGGLVGLSPLSLSLSCGAWNSFQMGAGS
jgi:hypothetical protein